MMAALDWMVEMLCNAVLSCVDSMASLASDAAARLARALSEVFVI